jgi:hypothetical protein
MDPRSAADGVSIADLQEQYEHNMRVHALLEEANAAVARVRAAQKQIPESSPIRPALDSIADRLITQPVRYGKPGLQAHIQYLSGMTARTDMKIGRDAIERYGVLKTELAAVLKDLARVLGPVMEPAPEATVEQS